MITCRSWVSIPGVSAASSSSSGPHSAHVEAGRSGGEAERHVVGEEGQGRDLLAKGQGACEMERIERPDERWKRLRCAAEDAGVERDEVDSLDGLEQCGAAFRQGSIVEARSNPQPVDGPKALDSEKLARDRPLEAGPLAQRIRLTQDDPEDDGRVDVRDHRRSAREHAVTALLIEDRREIDAQP